MRVLLRSGVGSLWLSLFLLAVSLAGTTTPVQLEAQVTRADSAAVILQTALEFEREGESGIAAALYRHIAERYPGTPAGDRARAWLSDPESNQVAQRSRVELPVFGTVYGLWLGIAVPLAAGSDSEEAFGAGLLIGGPAGLFIARAAQRSQGYSRGQVRAITWGGVFGTWQGLGWTEALDIGLEEFCEPSTGVCYDTGDNDEAVVTGMIIGGLAGITTGAIIARNPVGAGTSSAAQGASTWASIYGAMVAGLFDAEEDAVLTTALLAGDAGLLAGVGLARHYGLTRPRIRMINLGAVVGGLGGLGIDLLISVDDDETAIAIPLVTSIAGLLIAAAATSDGPSFDDGGQNLQEGGALLGWRDGRLHLDTPLPRPAMIPVDIPGERMRWRPGLTVELFRAKF